MSQQPQNFANHVRLHPLFHFILFPIFFLNLVISIVVLVRKPDWLTAWGLVMSLALLGLLGLVRMYPLKVQDRVIRLEERLRLNSLLPDPLRTRIYELSEEQLVALRFASDKEVPAIVQKTLTEHLRLAEIKKAISEWRADYWRV